jgi:arsenite-transporting ATPase
LSLKNEYQQIIWDTAPLGQTLGLLETPAMLRKHLKPAPRIYSRLKLGDETKRPIIEILKGWEKLSTEDMKFLRHDVAFTLVTIPEALAIEQLDGILAELERYGFRAEQLIINNVIKDISNSPFLREKAEQQRQYTNLVRGKYADMHIVEIPLFPHEIKGVERLRQIEQSLFRKQ